jgi:hypothetical protein
MTPLASALLIRIGGRYEGRPFEVVSPPNQLSSLGRLRECGPGHRLEATAGGHEETHENPSGPEAA